MRDGERVAGREQHEVEPVDGTTARSTAIGRDGGQQEGGRHIAGGGGT